MTKKEMEEKIKVLELRLSIAEEVSGSLASDVVELREKIESMEGWG